MFRLHVVALSAATVLGLALTSAQASWPTRSCAPVGPAPVVAWAPAPVVTVAPAPCPAPVVTAAPVVCQPVVRTYYRPAYSCGPQYIHYRHWCR
jgi:hypothetical protein